MDGYTFVVWMYALTFAGASLVTGVSAFVSYMNKEQEHIHKRHRSTHLTKDNEV
jgi:hypothetical protein